MENDLNLEGNKYKSRFLADKFERSFETGDHYTTHKENVFWWGGQGSITNKEDNSNRVFLFNTKEFYKKSVIKNLEEAIIFFDITNDWRGRKPEIVDYNSVIDEALEIMYNKVAIKQNGILSMITPPVLNFDDLMKKGLVVDETKQINLPLEI